MKFFFIFSVPQEFPEYILRDIYIKFHQAGNDLKQEDSGNSCSSARHHEIETLGFADSNITSKSVQD